MGNYYFNPNRNLKSGYCSLIVKKVERSHLGQWTCASRLTGSEHESYDEFRVTVFENGISMAGFSGWAFGIVVCLSAVVISVYTIYYNKVGKTNRRRATCQTAVSYIVEGDQISIASRRSNTSADHLSISSERSHTAA